MITKFTIIKDFGIFKDFDWNSKLRDKGNNIVNFKKLNIIYGRNYSGKTSLSRILRSLEIKKLPSKYENSDFKIEFKDKQPITKVNYTINDLIIRVYNEDFVKENLKWLTDELGDIKPFAIIGAKNLEDENEINKRLEQLGSAESGKGLKFDIISKKSDYEKHKQKASSLEIELDDKLRSKANQKIKTNPIYQNVNYNIKDIKDDIKYLQKTNFVQLNENEKENFKNILKEKAKKELTVFDTYEFDFISVVKSIKELLFTEIKPTEAIQDLVNNALLEDWVRKGKELHINKRDTCAFCGNILPKNLTEILDKHFNKQSEELRTKIQDFLKKIENFETDLESNVNQYIEYNKTDFYSIYHNELETISKVISENKKEFLKIAKKLKSELNNRLKEIFKKIELKEDFAFPPLKENQQKFNALIEKNNLKTKTLNEDQNTARKQLRLQEVYEYLEQIDYSNKIVEIENEKKEEKIRLSDFQNATNDIKKIENEIIVYQKSMNDEKKGAEKINEYLNHFFGNKHLELVAEETTSSSYKFVIKRDNQVAFNLSEGERSLISFCYFLAKLQDTETNNKKPIIWIDDPISSLDNNHIFFVFSLIESIITKPFKENPNSPNQYNYEQIFISTHNLDFFKYLKKLSMPRNENEYFIIERTSNSESRITLMPDYLKNYITEFNYLFHQIYKCALEENKDNHDIFYNFGNNLRKFLEAYLFYKYPYHTSDPKEKLTLFFGNDNTAVEVNNRISNELSHLEEIFDRSMKPIEIPEIPKLAKFVLKKLQIKDNEQFNSLLKSINVTIDEYNNNANI